jgi:hypothetical protein
MGWIMYLEAKNDVFSDNLWVIVRNAALWEDFRKSHFEEGRKEILAFLLIEMRICVAQRICGDFEQAVEWRIHL